MYNVHRSRAQTMGPVAWVGILALPYTRLGRLLHLLCLSFLISKIKIITWHAM